MISNKLRLNLETVFFLYWWTAKLFGRCSLISTSLKQYELFSTEQSICAEISTQIDIKKGLEVGTERGRWDLYVLIRELYQWPMSSKAKFGTFGNTYKDFHYNDFTYNFGVSFVLVLPI
jgi:hypothetical protein